MTKWQPIDTAPIEREVLVAGEIVRPAMLLKGLGWTESANGEYLWEGGSFGGPKPLAFAPTHWMQLPDPPK